MKRGYSFRITTSNGWGIYGPDSQVTGVNSAETFSNFAAALFEAKREVVRLNVHSPLIEIEDADGIKTTFRPYGRGWVKCQSNVSLR